jgi:hypothetical protein
MPFSRLDQVKAKANWADKHIRDLDAALKAFHNNSPRDFVRPEINPDTGETAFKVSKFIEVTPDISLIAGDAIGALRSSLDHLAYHIASVNSSSGVPAGRVSFLIADDVTKYMSPELKRVKKLLGDKAMKILDALKPYKGGGLASDRLWQLNELNNIAKHRFIWSTAMRFKWRTATAADYERMRRRMPNADAGVLSLTKFTNFGAPSGPMKVGDVIYVKPANLDEKVDFTFDVAFDEPIIDCESVFETIWEMSQLVKNIIPRFSAVL